MEMLKRSARCLTEFGFYAHLNGFGYLTSAIALVAENMTAFYAGRENIIDTLSRIYNVAPHSLRRCMTYAIRLAWQQKNSTLRKLFPKYTDDYPPSINEFVYRAAEELFLCHTAVLNAAGLNDASTDNAGLNNAAFKR